MEFLETTLEENFEEILDIAQISFSYVYPRKQLFARIKGRKNGAYVAKDGKRIIGFKVWYEDDDGQLYDWLDAVHPDYRRKGIATELMNMLFRFGKIEDYPKVKLKTYNRHPEMIRMCEKVGFKEVGRDPNHLGEGLEAIFFEYYLK